VIACSAGFPAPGRRALAGALCFFGTAGTEDFNYSELKQLDEELADRKAVQRVVIFDGSHEWAPGAHC